MKSIGLKILIAVFIQAIILSSSPLQGSPLTTLERIRSQHSSLESFLLSQTSLFQYFLQLSYYWNFEEAQFDKTHDLSVQTLLYLLDPPSHLELDSYTHELILKKLWSNEKKDFFPTRVISFDGEPNLKLIKSPSSFHSIWPAIYFELPESSWLHFALSGIDFNTTDYFLEENQKFRGILRIHQMPPIRISNSGVFIEFFGDFNGVQRSTESEKKIALLVLEEVRELLSLHDIFITGTKGLKEVKLQEDLFETKLFKNLFVLKDFYDGRDWIRQAIKQFVVEPMDSLVVNGEKRNLFSSLDFNNTGDISWVFKLSSKNSLKKETNQSIRSENSCLSQLLNL